jgi:hypothetical protein
MHLVIMKRNAHDILSGAASRADLGHESPFRVATRPRVDSELLAATTRYTSEMQPPAWLASAICRIREPSASRA